MLQPPTIKHGPQLGIAKHYTSTLTHNYEKPLLTHNYPSGNQDVKYEPKNIDYQPKSVKIDPDDVLYYVLIELLNNIMNAHMCSGLTIPILTYCDVVKDLEPHPSIREINDVLTKYQWNVKGVKGFYTAPDHNLFVGEIEKIVHMYT
jgi:hypothetical protein